MTIGAEVQAILQGLDDVKGKLGQIAADAVVQAQKQWAADHDEEVAALRAKVAELEAAIPAPAAPEPQPDGGSSTSDSSVGADVSAADQPQA